MDLQNSLSRQKLNTVHSRKSLKPLIVTSSVRRVIMLANIEMYIPDESNGRDDCSRESLSGNRPISSIFWISSPLYGSNTPPLDFHHLLSFLQRQIWFVLHRRDLIVLFPSQRNCEVRDRGPKTLLQCIAHILEPMCLHPNTRSQIH